MKGWIKDESVLSFYTHLWCLTLLIIYTDGFLRIHSNFLYFILLLPFLPRASIRPVTATVRCRLVLDDRLRRVTCLTALPIVILTRHPLALTSRHYPWYKLIPLLPWCIVVGRRREGMISIPNLALCWVSCFTAKVFCLVVDDHYAGRHVPLRHIQRNICSRASILTCQKTYVSSFVTVEWLLLWCSLQIMFPWRLVRLHVKHESSAVPFASPCAALYLSHDFDDKFTNAIL